MRRTVIFLLAGMLMLLAFTAAAEEPAAGQQIGNTAGETIPVSAIVSGVRRLDLIRGREAELEISVKPENATCAEVTFTSSDETVAAVSAQGRVTALKPGAFRITVSAKDASGKTLVIQGNVFQDVEEIILEEKSLSIPVGKVLPVKASVSPANAKDKKILWSSSDEKVCTVDANGRVKGVAPGQAVLTARAAGGNDVSGEISVAVVNPVKKITLSEKKIDAMVAQERQVTAEVLPEDASNRTLMWSSSDEKIAKVSQDGVITPVGKGNCRILVSAADGSGVKASLTVKVTTAQIREIIAENTELALPENTAWRQSIKTVPENLENGGIVWTSSDEKVAAVDGEGTITTKGIGKCVITGKAEEGGAEVSVNVEVRAFDYVITTPDQVEVEFDTERINSIAPGRDSKGSAHRRTETFTKFGSKGVAVPAGDHLISPVKAGDDVISVITMVDGRMRNKVEYTVFVDQSAVPEN